MCRGKKGSDQLLIELLSPAPKMRIWGEESQGSNPESGRSTSRSWECPTTLIAIANDELQAFQLVGNRYQAMESMAGRIWMPDLELGCSLWQGEYRVHYTVVALV